MFQVGLTLEFGHEHRLAPNKIIPMQESAGKGFCKMPEGRETDLPLMWSVRATKPE